MNVNDLRLMSDAEIATIGFGLFALERLGAQRDRTVPALVRDTIGPLHELFLVEAAHRKIDITMRRP